MNQTILGAAIMPIWLEMGKRRLDKEMVERLEAIATIDSQQNLAYICRALILGERGRLRKGLVELEQAISLEPEWPEAYFWKGMVYAYLGRDQTAAEVLEKALTMNLPPILLKPLYWLEKDRPKFYQKYAGPLLVRYDIQAIS